MERFSKRPPRLVVWLIPVLLTLHNAEEAIAFKEFAPTLQTVLPQPLAEWAAQLSYNAVLQALVALSAIVFILAAVVDLVPQSKSALWLLMTLELAVGLNAAVHLAAAAFVFHGYGPGLITAIGLNLPFAVYCFTRAAREHWLRRGALTATLPAAVLLHGPVLLAGLWLAARLNR